MLKPFLIPLCAVVGFAFLFGLNLFCPLPTILTVLLAFLLITPSFILPFVSVMPRGRARTLFQRAGEAITTPYLYLMICLAVDAFFLILFHFLHLDLCLPLLFLLSALLWALAVAAGMLHAKKIAVRRHSLTLPCDGINRGRTRVVVLSDLHLGFFTTKSLLERIGRTVADEKPDCVLIPGDLFDSDFDELKLQNETVKMLKSLPCREGLYICPGNHDGLALGDHRFDFFLSSCGATLLKDRSVSLPYFDLYGRKDAKVKRKSAEEVTASTLRTLVVLDHQPKEVKELAAGGASLILCGHTHNGQTFPGNLFALLSGRYNYGLKKCKDAYVLTTAGCGYWGLPMRLFTSNEIVVLDLTFE